MPYSSVRRTPILSTAIACILLAGCAQNAVVTPLSQKVRYTRGGVFYTLPITSFNVQMDVTRKESKPGRFAKYTPAFFPDAKYVEKVGTEFELGSPTVTSQGEPDPHPSRTYFAEIRGNPFITSTFSMTTNQGILTEGLSEVENKTVDFIVSTIEAGAKVAAKSFATPTSAKTGRTPKQRRYLRGAEIYGKQQLPEGYGDVIHLLVSDTPQGGGVEEAPAAVAATDEKKALADKIAKSPEWEKFRAEFDPAEDAYLEIEQRQKERLLVVTNENASDSATYSAQLAEMDRVLKDAGKVFFGTIQETKKPMTFLVRPSDYSLEEGRPRISGDVPMEELIHEPIPLFRFSAAEGIAEYPAMKNGFGAKLIGPTPFPAGNFEGGKRYLMEFICNRPVARGVAAGMSEKTNSKSFHYRIPGNAELRIGFAAGSAGPQKQTQQQMVNLTVHDERLRQTHPVAQYGTVAFLPAKSLSAKSRLEFSLNPTTGALQKVTVGRTAFDPKLVNRVGDAVEPLVGAIRAEEAADDAAADAARAARVQRNRAPSAVDKMKAELEVLELQVKIKEAKDKLNAVPANE